ncbi:MAG: hypothetical protein AB1349_12595 [Elusimicrobiota bacterium]
MSTNFLKIIIRILFLSVVIVSVLIHIKLPYYTNALENEIGELKKHLLLHINQKKYMWTLKQSAIGDAEVIKQEMIPQLESEKKALTEQHKNLKKENRLLSGQLDILTTKIILDIKLNRLKLVKSGKILFDIAITKKIIQRFVKSEIRRKKLKILAKEKNPAPIKPKWIYENITKEIPAENSPERLMIGALGNYAIYLTDFLIIHSYTKNVQQHDTINHVCIQLGLKEMKKLYNSVYIGNNLYVE